MFEEQDDMEEKLFALGATITFMSLFGLLFGMLGWFGYGIFFWAIVGIISFISLLLSVYYTSLCMPLVHSNKKEGEKNE